MSARATSASPAAAELIEWAEATLESITDSSRLEAELLLAEAISVPRAFVMAHPARALSVDQASRFENMVTRRRTGAPLAYVIGRKEFYSLLIAVGPDVLVPRPETETLVEAALERMPGAEAKVLDLGTGSGAIALALKNERPSLDITAVDSSAAALDIARANGESLGLNVNWRRSDWFSELTNQRFDLVVSNPPYVASSDSHFERGLEHEPRIALDGGADGLDAYCEIFNAVTAHLVPGGRLLVEHGFDQREVLIALALSASLKFDAGIDDLAGLPRVACFISDIE